MAGGRNRRVIYTIIVVICVIGAAAAAAAWWLHGKAAASLPIESGVVRLEGLGARVQVSRDGLGIPTIAGQSREDVSRALGFVHAQERFFQMDLMRRAAAGELSELVGAAALGMDRDVRPHRFRHRAGRVIEKESARHRRMLEAYASGVNAGLAALDAKPYEYMLIGAEPEPWTPEDTVLVIYAMFLDLNDERGSYEATESTMYDVLPPELAAFLAPAGCEWDAPVDGEPWPTPAIPGPDVLDLRQQPGRGACLPGRERTAPGSNNWAVAGSRTEHGGALLASDMHLDIAVPIIWYRAVLEWPDWRGGVNRIMGVTLPGAPAVVAGSNTHVAWGFTNSYGDWVDLVIVEPDPRDRNMYLTPDGPVAFGRVVERIEVKDGQDEQLTILTTIWGPVIGRDRQRRHLALRWTAHDVEAANLEIMGMEEARSIDDVLETAPTLGIPPQNCVTVDSSGRIGWTIAGRIPRRQGFDGRLPVSWADGTRGWNGWLETQEYPRIQDPDSGIIWTANTRVVDGAMFEKIGHGGYELGARASQIRDGLLAQERSSERSLLDVQLDDRALMLSRWHTLLLDLLDEKAIENNRPRIELRRLLDETWTGHASVDSVAYRLVRQFRLVVFAEVYAWLTAPCLEADASFDFNHLTQWEGPLWKLVTERPVHLLEPGYGSWEQALLEMADRVVSSLPKPLSERSWGEHNTTAIRHPLSLAVPALARLLDMPAEQIPGDAHMPRVIEPGFGASERFVVSPGKEGSGIFHMPCGQSGHFLSPHYSDGHEAWVKGEPTPFLPGRTASILELVP